ncbi:glycosyltransferase family 4 protein [Candidatus Saccharibacteria bacterium]|nr:glycosyltransferase family 4 protein [Candidatus Saccharibacteria bacterium]
MKVLMLGWELPPHHTGGMGIVCYQMCKQLARSGADIEFVLPYTADFSHIDFMKINPALPDDVEEIIGSYVGGSTYDSQYFEYVLSDGSTRGAAMSEHQSNYADYVSRLVRYSDYDVIHAHDWLTFRAALAAKQASGCPLFVHIHSTEFDRSGGGSGNPLVREIEYIGLQLADKIFAVSQATKETIVREYGVNPDKIEVVHNAMEFEAHELYEDTSDNTFRYLEQMQHAGYGVVVSAGRLTIQKGLTHLLAAFRFVVDVHPKSLLLIVGPGEQYYELIEYAASLGLSGNVIFTGHLNGTGKQWRDAFRVGNLFVMPSVSEPFGITPFEALAHGTPALISKQTGSSEILRNVLKVDYWDANEMANQIVSVLQNHDLEQTLAENGHEELISQTWQRSATTMMRHYHHHVERRRAPQRELAYV